MTGRFSYVRPDEDQFRAMDTLRHSYSLLATDINDNCPAGRYAALAITYQEISAMFANKAVTHPES